MDPYLAHAVSKAAKLVAMSNAPKPPRWFQHEPAADRPVEPELDLEILSDRAAALARGWRSDGSYDLADRARYLIEVARQNGARPVDAAGNPVDAFTESDVEELARWENAIGVYDYDLEAWKDRDRQERFFQWREYFAAELVRRA
jgi:hypothetical protein